MFLQKYTRVKYSIKQAQNISRQCDSYKKDSAIIFDM